ncbi:MAG TPA: hypothetical protein PLK90_01695 [Clostridiales bacterium]|mgnify:CR=1 FL=1|jgi:protein-arginine kinase|nr:hypothetical protein [Clostridiales bacterium]HQP69088.1 hypothetical protein [Clostridiales bacterium]
MPDLTRRIPDWFMSDDNRVSLYSSVKIVRNFKYINFPDQADLSAVRQIGKKTDEVLEKMIGEGEVKVIDISSSDDADITRLQKFRILPNRSKEILSRMKLYHYETTDSYLLTNYNDHLTFFAHATGKDIEIAYGRCLKFIKLFDYSEFAADKNGNYLTASLDYFGTGLKCFSVLTIPAIRLFGSAEEILSDLKAYCIDSSGYFSKDINYLTIITGKDSISKTSDEFVKYFGNIIRELDNICSGIVKNKIAEIGSLKQKCERIFNYDILTFKDFMEIYYILSLVADTGCAKGSVSELNRELVELINSLPRTEPDQRIDSGVLQRLKVKTEKLFK